MLGWLILAVALCIIIRMVCKAERLLDADIAELRRKKDISPPR